MNTLDIVKRAWRMLWRYRALWVWGIVLALTTCSWSAWSLANLGDAQERDWQGLQITVRDNETFGEAWRRTWRAEIDEANQALEEVLADLLHVQARVNVVALLFGLIGLALTLQMAGRVARYVSETALVRTVDQYEETGERQSVWQGLRLGWSYSAWRFFLINLVIDLVGVGGAFLLFGLLFGPLPLWVNGGTATVFVFSFLTAGLFFVAIVAVILWSVTLAVLKRLAWRACALEGLGVFPAIRRGCALLARHLKHVGGVWLVAAGVRWGWRAAMVPVVLTLLGLGLLTGSLPALLVGGATSLFSHGALSVILALVVGISLFLLVLLGPLVFLAGLREVFVSTTWTLAYRDLCALQRPVAERFPSADKPGLKAAHAVS